MGKDKKQAQMGRAGFGNAFGFGLYFITALSMPPKFEYVGNYPRY